MGQDYKFKVMGKEYTPQQLSAFILQKIKQDADAYWGDKVEESSLHAPHISTITSARPRKTPAR
jgi:molecular chaperone DnaK